MKQFKIKKGKKTWLVKAADKDSALDKLVEKGFIEKMEDSDKLKQLAYEFGQKGAYFDRANSANSRNILGKDDEVKYQDFVNTGFKVYEQLKQEVDNVQKTGRSFGKYETWSDTLNLIKDGLNRLFWASDNVNSSARAKGKALAEKLENLTKEYWQRMHGIKDEESPERKAQEWVDYDLKHYGHVSEETKNDIKKMGLDFDKWDNQVKDAYSYEVDTVNGDWTTDGEFENIKRETKKYNVNAELVRRDTIKFTGSRNDLERYFKQYYGTVEPGQIKDCDCKPISDCDMSNVEVKDAANFTKYQYVDACKYIDDAWYKLTDNVADGILQAVGLTNRIFDNAWTKLKNLIDNDDKLSDTDKAELEKYF